MSHKSPGWVARCIGFATGQDRNAIADLRAQMMELRARIDAVDAENAARAASSGAGLAALRDAMDRDERIEALRLRVEGLCAQHRWDTDELRKALTAVAEHLPLAH